MAFVVREGVSVVVSGLQRSHEITARDNARREHIIFGTTALSHFEVTELARGRDGRAGALHGVTSLNGIMWMAFGFGWRLSLEARGIVSDARVQRVESELWPRLQKRWKLKICERKGRKNMKEKMI